VDTRGGPRIARQLLGGGKPPDVPHLDGDHHGQRQPHPWQGQQLLNHRGRLERRPHPLLERAHLAVQRLDLLEPSLGRVRRVGRQPMEALAQEDPTAHAEEIAHLDVVEAYFAKVA
jgi:hypothetical protein